MRMVVAQSCAKTDSCFPSQRGHTLSARKMRQKGPSSATFQWIQPHRPRCGARIAVAHARGWVSRSLVYVVHADYCLSLHVIRCVGRAQRYRFPLLFASFFGGKKKKRRKGLFCSKYITLLSSMTKHSPIL